MAFTDFGLALTLCDTGGLKIWNLKTLACIRTLECGNAICSSFLPGDRHVRAAPVCFCYKLMPRIGSGWDEIRRHTTLQRGIG